MKIAAIIDSLQGGGAEKILTLLAYEWACAGNTVDIFTFKESSLQNKQHPNLKLHPALGAHSSNQHGFATKILLIPLLLYRLRKNLLKNRPDVIICFMDQANILTLLATVGMLIPVIVSERIYPAHSSLLTATASQPLRHLISYLRNRIYRRARRIVLQSDRSIEFFPLNLHQKIIVIPNPICTPEVQGLAVEIPQPTIFSLGRLVSQKRFDLLIGAFHLISREFPEWHLLIAGTGPKAQELQAQAESGSGSGQIHFLGYQGNTGALFAQATIFVLASDYEGFPVALGEALVCGVPSIATDCLTGPREILAESEYGLLIPANDLEALARAIKSLITDPGLREHYARAGKARAEEFSLQKILPLWEHVLAEITNETSSL